MLTTLPSPFSPHLLYAALRHASDPCSRPLRKSSPGYSLLCSEQSQKTGSVSGHLEWGLAQKSPQGIAGGEHVPRAGGWHRTDVTGASAAQILVPRLESHLHSQFQLPADALLSRQVGPCHLRGSLPLPGWSSQPLASSWPSPVHWEHWRVNQEGKISG